LDDVESGYNHFVKGLRNLIKFLEKKGKIPKGFAEELKELLKVRRTGTDTYVPPDDLLRKTLAKIDREEYEILFKLLGYSGIRIREAIYLLESFDPNKLHFVDGIAYYDLEWERGTKKSFKAFMPTEFAKKLRKIGLNKHSISSYIVKRGVRPKHLRNWQANKLVRARIQESVINFIQGRSPNTVFATHYLAKVNEAIAAYKEVVEDLKAVLEG
jgi:intergrase/recombinase